MSRCLVTGASGFIGSHMVRYLINKKESPIALVRYKAPERNYRLKHCWDFIPIMEADIRNRGAVLDAMKACNPEYVFHFAAYNHVGQSFTQSEECIGSNVLGTVNVVDAAHEVNPECRVVYISSSEIYGAQERVPWDEGMAPSPQSPYAVSKYAGELYCSVRQEQGWPITIIRPFNVYGPGQSSKALIPEVINKALKGKIIRTTEGKQTREYTYVSDTVRGIYMAAKEEVLGPINIGSGNEMEIREIIRKILKETGSKSRWETDIPTRPNEIMRMKCSNELARSMIGWEPEVSFDDGLIKAIDSIRELM